MFTVHDDEMPPEREKLFEKGAKHQDQGRELIRLGFLEMARSRGLSFEELMMGQGFMLGKLTAEIVSFGKDEAQAVYLGEAMLKQALKWLPSFVKEAQRKQASVRAASPAIAEEEASSMG